MKIIFFLFCLLSFAREIDLCTPPTYLHPETEPIAFFNIRDDLISLRGPILQVDTSESDYGFAQVPISSYTDLSLDLFTFFPFEFSAPLVHIGDNSTFLQVERWTGGMRLRIVVGGNLVAEPSLNCLDERLWIYFSFSISGNSVNLYCKKNDDPQVTSASPQSSTITLPQPIDLSQFADSIFFIRDPSTSSAYIAALKEVRMWNRALSTGEMATLSSTALSPTSEVVHHWKFEGPVGGTNTFSDIGSMGSPSSNIAVFGSPLFFNPGFVQCVLDEISNTVQFNQLPLITVIDKKISIEDPETQVRVSATPSRPSSSPLSFPPRLSYFELPEGTLCSGDSLQCRETFTDTAASSPPFLGDEVNFNLRTFELTYEFNREACGKIESLLMAIEGGDSEPTAFRPINMTVNFDNAYDFQLDASDFGGVYISAPTVGESLEIVLNKTIGPIGNFGSEEAITFRPSNGLSYSCLTPSVASGNRITCNIPAGKGGEGSIEVRLCNRQVTLSSAFTYQEPIVSNVTLSTLEASRGVITILGEQFGPPRGGTDTDDSVTLTSGSDSAPCQIESITQTSITCVFEPNAFDNNSTLTVSVTIGNQLQQNSPLQLSFVRCRQACQNGGECAGVDICNCLNTGFEGDLCERRLLCSPPCRNGGVCTRETSDNSTFCACQEGFTGRDCNERTDSSSSDGPSAAVIGGAVGAVALVIIALVIVVIVLALRKPKRQVSAAFVPLEKKDFTKIIYGDQLTAHAEKNVGNLSELEELLLKEDMELVFEIGRITQITEADKIAKALVIIFQDHDRVVPLLKTHISNEVKGTENAGNLFRSNSMVSKMFKFYSRLIGLPYLYITIGPEVDKLIFDELGLEVDPEKMEEGSDLDEMRWMLMAQSQKILVQILNSVDKCPPQFRVLFTHIKEVVASKYPNNIYTTIGGFIFLRFFCPAISSPEAYGIVEEPPSPASRRLLILITKVLQNLSNDVEFGAKEPYMTKMNDFIQTNRVKLRNFYDKLIKPPSKPPVTVDLPKNIKGVNLAVVAKHLQTNLDKIENKELRKKVEDIVGKEA